jgi:MoaA/NifB/PqqE/SkfB family radical SAM enzyme
MITKMVHRAINWMTGRRGTRKSSDGYTQPVELDLYLTRKCNASCPRCLWLLQRQDLFTQESMDPDCARRIIDAYVAEGVKRIRVQAEGEVLLYEHFTDIVDYAGSRGSLALPLVTNGIRLAEFAEFVAPRMAVTISIDGYDPPTYNEHRGGNEETFRKVLQGVRELVRAREKLEADRRHRITINCILGRFNFRYVEPMVKLAEELGVDQMSFGNYHPTDGDDETWAPLRQNDDEVVRYFRGIVERNDWPVDVRLPGLYGPLEKLYCNSLFETAVIGTNGDLAPCCHMNAAPGYGNVQDGLPAHNSPALTALRADFLAADDKRGLLAICRQCPRLHPDRARFDRASRCWYVPDYLMEAPGVR